eukprot:CAMPEP_0195521926 /NCGR_PEP_ID=MMETSP0794_2-20130614/19698_1 /TAXON_ID=515487 /ORGANISM="Stephanopyxis turris, Strain CCMP 815" /LENGTH=59 /DNA_ID=CAMNT_0040651581 /DNA_START=1 /DNA_END=180 /DNA_ORIENTATION=+
MKTEEMVLTGMEIMPMATMASQLMSLLKDAEVGVKIMINHGTRSVAGAVVKNVINATNG